MRGETDPTTNEFIRGEMKKMAQSMGIDALPMRNPEFDFFNWASRKSYRMGFKGQDTRNLAYQVIQRLFTPLSGATGPIYNFPTQSYKKYFDDYFMMAFEQKILDDWGAMYRYWKSHGSFESGDPEIRGEEEQLGIDGSVFEYVAFKDEMLKFDAAMEQVPGMLSEQRGGDKLAAIWEAWKSGIFKLREIAQYLTVQGVPTVRGGPWTTGSVSSMEAAVKKSVRDHMDKLGVDWRFIRGYFMNRRDMVSKREMIMREKRGKKQ